MFHYKQQDIYFTILLAVLYYATAYFSSFVFSNPSIISIGVFIPEGIALAFALYFGPKVVPGIFLGQFLFAWLNTHLPVFSLVVGIINSLEALLGIYLFSKFKLNSKLISFRDIIGLFILSLFILQPFSAITCNLFLLFNGNMLVNEFFLNTFSWWFGNIMGQALYTPTLLLLFNNYKKIDIKEYIFYAFFYGTVVFFILYILLIQNPFLVMSITLPLLIFIVFHKGIVYGTMLTVMLSLVSSFSFIWHIGVFQVSSSFDNTINYNLFILVHVFISLTVGLLFEERKRYEEELQDIIDEEVQKNKEQQLLMVQQSRLAQMGEMISMIAHQWRQPLNNLALINQLLISKYYKNQLDDKTLEYFKSNSKKQINLMSTTIDDFRNFFKTETEQKEVEMKFILETILEMTKPIYTNHGINLVSNIDGCIKVYGYPNALAQAILNIINNAKDALIEQDIPDKKIELSVIKKDDEIIITICDNAGGIDPQIMDKIFDPYFSTKKEKNGTGLGLYMTKMIIEEQLEAKITVKNREDGAEFTIYLKGTNCEQ